MTIRLPMLCGALALAGCNSIPIDVGTKEPVKVDIAMKVDVYQHADPNGPKKPAVLAPVTDVAKSRRNRMGEIQILKNSRLVGENHAGYLEVRTQPPGEYGDYVKTTVDAENSDRGRLIEKLAKEKNIPVSQAERQQAELFQKGAFTGEWIEEPDANGKFAWMQKE
ncbi:MAG: YdbL family protein [Chthoniobacter sp.]|nr:YdbL family protein [Chthoniobacter sp.]